MNANNSNKTAIDLDDCGRYKTCFVHPYDCMDDSKNCTGIVTWKKHGDDYVEFEMYEKSYDYIAIGLSKDKKMVREKFIIK